MDPLKIFATLETSLSETQLHDILAERGWSIAAGLHCLTCATCTLQLEHSGGGLYNLRGELSRTDNLDKLLEPLISALSHDQWHMNLDIFEEDGRLVKRIQT